jgi:hypothetical protein
MSPSDSFPLYLAPDGTELTQDEWAELWGHRRAEDHAEESWWRKRTVIDDDVTVSTVWLGLNHGLVPGRPLYWETMIFGGPCDEHQWRYGSREDALDDHERILAELRAGRCPE